MIHTWQIPFLLSSWMRNISGILLTELKERNSLFTFGSISGQDKHESLRAFTSTCMLQENFPCGGEGALKQRERGRDEGKSKPCQTLHRCFWKKFFLGSIHLLPQSFNRCMRNAGWAQCGALWKVLGVWKQLKPFTSWNSCFSRERQAISRKIE